MQIGPFSRASGLSVKALRAYHESGLLVPARVDPQSGYRAYHAAQLIDAALIARLRSLDLPLEQVRRVVHSRDPLVTAEVLAAHKSAMRARLDEVAGIVAELQTSASEPAANTPVHVTAAAPQLTLAIRGRVTEATFAAFLATAFDELAAAIDRCGLVAAGPRGGLYPPELADDDGDDVEAYVPVTHLAAIGDSGRVVVSETPSITAAALVHSGPYDTIGDTYRLLGGWVAAFATPRPLPVRERYLIGPADVDDPAEFRTEIQWPIEPLAPSQPDHPHRGVTP